MKNINEWKELIKEVMGVEVEYSDKVSIFAKHEFGYVVIESEGCNGLQIQYRKSLDHSDIVVSENIIAGGKIVSTLVPSNYEDVKKVISEFIQKL